MSQSVCGASVEVLWQLYLTPNKERVVYSPPKDSLRAEGGQAGPTRQDQKVAGLPDWTAALER